MERGGAADRTTFEFGEEICARKRLLNERRNEVPTFSGKSALVVQ